MAGLNELKYSGAQSTNNMRLFGLPYQFTDVTDPRYRSVSSIIGKSYLDHVVMQGLTCYIIPGKAEFLPDTKSDKKGGITRAFLEASNSGDLNPLRNILSEVNDDELRFYDFQESYNDYMKYVNIMCRTVATYLELTEPINVNGKDVSLQQYDWKNYRWNRDRYTTSFGNQVKYIAGTAIDNLSTTAKTVANALTGRSRDMGEENVLELETDDGETNQWNLNYIQFYIDPTSGVSKSHTNGTGPSQLKSMLDTASSQLREWQFMADSAGVNLDKPEQFVTSAMGAISELTDNMGSLGKVVSRILNSGSAIIKGDNVFLPEIYNGSEYSTSYEITIHLRTPYGNKLAVYMDVIVPLLHLLALVAPRQQTANSFGSPFLIKAYCPGTFNCTLGMVDSLSTTVPTSDDAWSTDGLPTEIDVRLSIKDLYSDLSLSPSNNSHLFSTNSSLIDYLATISGINLIEPQMKTKYTARVNNFVRKIADIPTNAMAEIADFFDRRFIGMTTL